MCAEKLVTDLCFTTSDEVGDDVICLKAMGLILGHTLGSLELLRLPMLGSTARESNIIDLGGSRGTGSFPRSWGDFNGSD